MYKMQCLEVSDAVRSLKGSLGFKGLSNNKCGCVGGVYDGLF